MVELQPECWGSAPFSIFAGLGLIIVFVFNPGDLRTKLIDSVINSYLENTLPDYQSGSIDSNYDHPLLDASQEATLENFGVDVSQLPTSITPGMQACFTDKLGESRVLEIINGATPSALEIFKAKDCLGQ